MALDPNKFTRKTQEAIGAAQAAGRDAGNTEIAPEHLLRALLDQPEGVVNGVLERIGVDLGAVRRPGRRSARPAAAGDRRDRARRRASRPPRSRCSKPPTRSASSSTTSTSRPSTCCSR